MHYRTFGRDDIRVSEVGLGCWQIGGNWGEVSDATAESILQASIANGVTFLDTADVYGEGRSERTIGNFLKKAPEEVFVATKVGRLGLYPDNYNYDSIRVGIEASLERLQTDRLDLVQLHCIPHEVLKRGEVFTWLDQLVGEGLIARYGASVESMEEARTCMEKANSLYSLQIIFNLFRQKPAEVLLDDAAAKKIAIIARVPLASGLLSGKMSAGQDFEADDHRLFNRDGAAFNVGETFAGLPYEKGLELVESVREILPTEGTMAQQSLRWILDHPAVSVVIPGASKIQQANDNASASEFPPLSREVHNKLKLLYADQVKAHIRGPY